MKQRAYFVHYQGWNKRYDEWISEESILGPSRKQLPSATATATATAVCIDETPRIRFSKREKKTKKPIDWSPNPTPSSFRVTEKLTSLVKADYKHKPSRVSKPAPSPALKRSSALRVFYKQPQPSPLPPPPPPAFTTSNDDSTEESITSDDEDEDTGFPRSYIDTLAKQKKREERKRKRQRQQQQEQEQQQSSLKDGEDLLVENTCKSSSPINHFAAGDVPLSTHTPTTPIDTASSITALVSDPLAECLGFSNIEADHNYSSLRFHYSDSLSFDNIRMIRLLLR
ncbi:hypothetical protein KIN20_007163 [Parelaphostrongylus tenuis]|uniref:Tudor-knot domain-containing protein n=1 Tax=Parelaphostrongylus tenuis TaxID=148309 RepID=A0AAD5QGN2_PARTN|nr:hypothetical protein KIN20_007163 [Parelaphostrongylus tenuis]